MDVDPQKVEKPSTENKKPGVADNESLTPPPDPCASIPRFMDKNGECSEYEKNLFLAELKTMTTVEFMSLMYMRSVLTKVPDFSAYVVGRGSPTMKECFEHTSMIKIRSENLCSALASFHLPRPAFGLCIFMREVNTGFICIACII